jgi:type IV secretory pathway VirD2 relaxase
MTQTKRFWNKPGGNTAYHAYQAFKPGEVTPEQCHEIGVRLAQKLWGDRFEVVVATHLDQEHLHNHFVLNSVSFKDGYKFYDSERFYRRMVRESAGRPL